VFKVVKPKKRKPKQEPAIGSLTKATGMAFASAKLFDVKKYVVPSGGASSNKDLPSSGSENSSEDVATEVQGDKKSNVSMRSGSPEDEHKGITEKAADHKVAEKKTKLDYSFVKKLFNIVKGKKPKE
jgi:hypothetical protein